MPYLILTRRAEQQQILLVWPKSKEKIRKLTAQCGERVDSDLQADLLSIMNEKTEAIYKAYPPGSFSRLFWDEQLRAASVANARQIHWHPLIIKCCLNLKLISSGAYHALRSSGFVTLPSERTLRDYTHYFKEKLGFQKEILAQLNTEVKNLQGFRRYVSLIFDEIKIWCMINIQVTS